jgi:glyoxylase-like metal-dependent hydrolase (beta-lactamase superfamily II)
VLATHTHDNHIRGIKTLKKIYDTTLYGKTSRIFEHPCTRVHDGDMLDCSGIPVEVIEIPGHSVDSVVYRIDRYLFTGDVLYAGKVGSALSSYARVNLISSIRNKLLVYDDDSVVFPGHGPPSTIGAERRFNIALRD